MMKLGFICMVTAVTFFSVSPVILGDTLNTAKLIELGFVDPDEQINAFRKALSEADILRCREAVSALFEKACRDGSLRDVKKFDTIRTMVAHRVLDTRIDREDTEPSRRFESMEYFMHQFKSCGAIAQTNVYFIKLADYLSGEQPISLEGRMEEIETARRKDQALIAAGAIERPLIIVGRPRTPNLVAARIRYERIKKWNDTVQHHRRRVASMFAKPIAQYLHSLNPEEAEAFCGRFIKRAGLTEEEEDLLFPERAKKKPRKQAVGAQQEKHDVSASPPDVKKLTGKNPFPKRFWNNCKGKGDAHETTIHLYSGSNHSLRQCCGTLTF